MAVHSILNLVQTPEIREEEETLRQGELLNNKMEEYAREPWWVFK